MSTTGHTRRTSFTVTIELGPEAAAGLKRFAEKVSFEQAKSVLYGHLNSDLRSDQAADIITAFGVLNRALDEAGVTSWPWVETGRP